MIRIIIFSWLITISLVLFGCSHSKPSLFDSCYGWGVDGFIKSEHLILVNKVAEIVRAHGINPVCRVRFIYNLRDANSLLPMGVNDKHVAGYYRNCIAYVNVYDFGDQYAAGTLAHEIGHHIGIKNEDEAKRFARDITEHME